MNYSQSTRDRLGDIKRGIRAVTTAFSITTQVTTTIFATKGRILVNALFAEVTTLLDSHAVTAKFRFQSTTPVIAIADICAASDSASGLAVGQRIICPTATIATKADITGAAGVGFWPSVQLIIGTPEGVGLIAFTTGGADLHSGAVTFSCYYVPLDPGASVTPSF